MICLILHALRPSIPFHVLGRARCTLGVLPWGCARRATILQPCTLPPRDDALPGKKQPPQNSAHTQQSKLRDTATQLISLASRPHLLPLLALPELPLLCWLQLLLQLLVCRVGAPSRADPYGPEGRPRQAGHGSALHEVVALRAELHEEAPKLAGGSGGVLQSTRQFRHNQLELFARVCTAAPPCGSCRTSEDESVPALPACPGAAMRASTPAVGGGGSGASKELRNEGRREASDICTGGARWAQVTSAASGRPKLA